MPPGCEALKSCAPQAATAWQQGCSTCAMPRQLLSSHLLWSTRHTQRCLSPSVPGWCCWPGQPGCMLCLQHDSKGIHPLTHLRHFKSWWSTRRTQGCLLDNTDTAQATKSVAVDTHLLWSTHHTQRCLSPSAPGWCCWPASRGSGCPHQSAAPCTEAGHGRR
jgi:hypothetical protein